MRELHDLLTSLGLDSDPATATAVLQKYDTNQTGLLELPEFSKFIRALGAHPESGGGADLNAALRAGASSSACRTRAMRPRRLRRGGGARRARRARGARGARGSRGPRGPRPATTPTPTLPRRARGGSAPRGSSSDWPRHLTASLT